MPACEFDLRWVLIALTLISLAPSNSVAAGVCVQSTGWRIFAQQTFWDVTRVKFLIGRGSDFPEYGSADCNQINSASAADPGHGGFAGYEMSNAFQDGGLWGGREEIGGASGCWIGFQCSSTIFEVQSIQLKQWDGAYKATSIQIQTLQAGAWNTVTTITERTPTILHEIWRNSCQAKGDAFYVIVTGHSFGAPYGSCAAAGYADVESEAECEAAATALGLQDVSASLFNNPNLPSKCHNTNGELFWCETCQALGNEVCGQYQRACICRKPTDVSCISTATQVAYNSYVYRTLYSAKPLASTQLNEEEKIYATMPPGFSIAPGAADIAANVIASYKWDSWGLATTSDAFATELGVSAGANIVPDQLSWEMLTTDTVRVKSSAVGLRLLIRRKCAATCETTTWDEKTDYGSGSTNCNGNTVREFAGSPDVATCQQAYLSDEDCLYISRKADGSCKCKSACTPVNTFYHSYRKVCQAYGCTTASGTGCATCVTETSRTSTTDCATCNPGYYLSGTTCQAHGCTTGSATNQCATCVTQSFRTSATDCASCNAGNFLSLAKNCEAYACSIGSGTSCATCVEPTARTGSHQCTACNPGYYLSGTTCQAHGCTTGSGIGCATCVGQTARTSATDCATCNLGYFASGKTCQAYGCSIGADINCASCVAQALRTSAVHCATCNPGYELCDTTCQAFQYTSVGNGYCYSGTSKYDEAGMPAVSMSVDQCKDYCSLMPECVGINHGNLGDYQSTHPCLPNCCILWFNDGQAAAPPSVGGQQWNVSNSVRNGQGPPISTDGGDTHSNPCYARIQAYCQAGVGIAGEAGQHIWHLGAAKGLGVQSCYEAVIADFRCAQDYFTYVARGDENCGCKTFVGALITRSDTNSDYYLIKATAIQSTPTTTTTMATTLPRRATTMTSTWLVSTVTTSTTTSLAEVKVSGSLQIEVSHAQDFVKDPNVTVVLKSAIAEMVGVNISWVTNIRVTLLTRRLSGQRRVDTTSMTTKSGVKVEFDITVPPDPDGKAQVTAEIILETFNQRSIEEATELIKTALDSGMLTGDYEAEVSYKIIRLQATTTTQAVAQEEDAGEVVMLGIAIASLVFSLVLFGCLVVYMRRKMRSRREEDALLKMSLRKNMERCLNLQTPEGFLEEAGPLATASLLQILNPAEPITPEQHKDLIQLILAILDSDEIEHSEVFICYALDERRGDAEDAGRGLFNAAAVLKAFHDCGVHGFLAVPGEPSRATITDMLRVPGAGCKTLAVLETEALFGSRQCLQEIYLAQEQSISITRLRFEEGLPTTDQWSCVKAYDADGVKMVTAVEQAFGLLPSVPPRPFTIKNQVNVLEEVVMGFKTMTLQQLGSPCVLGRKSPTDSEQSATFVKLGSLTPGDKPLDVKQVEILSKPVKSKRSDDSDMVKATKSKHRSDPKYLRGGSEESVKKSRSVQKVTSSSGNADGGPDEQIKKSRSVQKEHSSKRTQSDRGPRSRTDSNAEKEKDRTKRIGKSPRSVGEKSHSARGSDQTIDKLEFGVTASEHPATAYRNPRQGSKDKKSPKKEK